MFDRIPPHSDEAEIAVLGACMIDNEAARMACASIEADDFYNTAHANIFRVIAKLVQLGRRPDLVTVHDALIKLRRLDGVGGPAYIRHLIDETPSSANIEYYCVVVAEKSIIRRKLRASMEMVQACMDDRPLDEINAIEDSFDIAARSQNVEPLKEVLHRINDQVESGVREECLSTGLPELDQKLGDGLFPGVTVVAGRPGMGKTSFVSWIASSVVRAGHSVLFVTLEMKPVALARRWIAAQMGVPSQCVRRGDNPEAIVAASGELAPMDIRFFEGDRLPEIALLATHVKLVIIDNLQLLAPTNVRDGRVEQISQLTRSLKRLTREQDKPLILVSHLNRKVEERDDKRPRMADLRESGTIEQDADNVLMLYRPRYYGDHEGADMGPDGFETVCLNIAKQRDGDSVTLDSLRVKLATMTWMTEEAQSAF